MPDPVRDDLHPKGKGCWYFTHAGVCVLCGREDVIRERRWGVKPDDPAERIDVREEACDGHFV